jgi:cytochrome c
MNSFELNKFLGALLGTCLVLMAIHVASGALFSTPAPP